MLDLGKQSVVVLRHAINNVSLALTDDLLASVETEDLLESLNPMCTALWDIADEPLLRIATDVSAFAFYFGCDWGGGGCSRAL